MKMKANMSYFKCKNAKTSSTFEQSRNESWKSQNYFDNQCIGICMHGDERMSRDGYGATMSCGRGWFAQTRQIHHQICECNYALDLCKYSNLQRIPWPPPPLTQLETDVIRLCIHCPRGEFLLVNLVVRVARLILNSNFASFYSLSSLFFSLQNFFWVFRAFRPRNSSISTRAQFSSLPKIVLDAIEVAAKHGERPKIISILFCKIANFQFRLKWRSKVREYCQIKTGTYTCDLDNFSFFTHFLFSLQFWMQHSHHSYHSVYQSFVSPFSSLSLYTVVPPFNFHFYFTPTPLWPVHFYQYLIKTLMENNLSASNQRCRYLQIECCVSFRRRVSSLLVHSIYVFRYWKWTFVKK